MNALVANSLAQDHADTLVANAAAARRGRDTRPVRHALRRIARQLASGSV